MGPSTGEGGGGAAQWFKEGGLGQSLIGPFTSNWIETDSYCYATKVWTIK